MDKLSASVQLMAGLMPSLKPASSEKALAAQLGDLAVMAIAGADALAAALESMEAEKVEEPVPAPKAEKPPKIEK